MINQVFSLFWLNTLAASGIKAGHQHMEQEVLNNLFTRVTVFVALNGAQTAGFLSMVAVVRQMTHKAKLEEIASQF